MTIQIQSRDPDVAVVAAVRWMAQLSVNDLVKKVMERDVAPPASASGPPSGICPLSRKIITKPARGVRCDHAECFDLVGYCAFGAKLNVWVCPICHKPTPPEDLRLDPSFLTLVRPP
jgi:hypothetical protein